MKLEAQVTNRELSEKLGELGVVRESFFSYAKLHEGMTIKPTEYLWPLNPTLDCIPAYTVAELGEMLPDWFGRGELIISKSDALWGVDYYEFDTYDAGESILPVSFDACGTMPDAMARMLVYLLENGHVDVAEVNRG